MKQENVVATNSCWKRKSKLEKKLTISLALSVFLLSGFVIYVIYKHFVVTKSCATPGCLLAASQIISHIDPSIDPCDDFFQFACGKFIRHIHGDNKARSVKELEKHVERQLTEIINEPIKEDDHPLLKKQKKMFKICMNETAKVEEEATNIFNTTLEEFGGWPVVVGPNWNASLFDWKDLLYKFRQMGYPHDMMLDISVIEDIDDSNGYILYISEPFVNKPDESEKQFYQQFMTDVAIQFGADEKYASIEMEKVIDFMEKLSKVVDKSIDKSDNDTTVNSTAEMLSNRVTIQEYQNNYTQIDWLSFLNNILQPSANLSNNDYVIFAKEEYMDALLDLLERTPKRVQANYMIWSIMEMIIIFLSEDLQELSDSYDCLTNSSPTFKSRLKFCKLFMSKFFQPLPSDIAYARKYLPLEKKEKVKDMLKNIKNEFIDLLKQNAWMDKESIENTIDKANSIGEAIGMPDNYFDDSIFEKYYSEKEFVLDSEDNLFSIFTNHMKFLESRMYGRLNKSKENFDPVLYHFVTDVNAFYSLDYNLLMLPVAILQGLFYNTNRPSYLNYGTLGSLIGHEVTHGLSKEASGLDKYGKPGKMWTEETAKAFDEISQCIIEDAESFNIQNTEKNINGTQTLEENIADLTGMKVSYNAYKKWVQRYGEELPLSGIHYNPYQLFWISAISDECYKQSGKTLEILLKNDLHAHNEFRATSPMRHNPDFAKDFNCPTNSKMNPSKKCQVF